MQFVSLFSAVHLSGDPESGVNGDIYFNSIRSVYRIKSQGIWVDLLDENNHLDHTANKSIVIGDETTESFNITLDESYDESTVYAFSASPSQIIVGHHEDYPYRIGTNIKIIRAGNGSISIVPDTEAVSISIPSPSYLTFNGDYINLINISEDKWVVDGPFKDIY